MSASQPPDIMPPELFETVGRALYGDGWKAAVARLLDTQPSRVSQILAGQRHARTGFARQMLAAIPERRAELDQAEAALQAWLGEVDP